MTFASTLDITESEERRVSEFLAALRSPCIVTQNKDSYLVSDAFENEFRSRLLANHCFIGSPLFQESFDSAFIAASEFAGFKVARAPEGQRFWDVSINDKRISLKSGLLKKPDRLQHILFQRSKPVKLAAYRAIDDCYNC